MALLELTDETARALNGKCTVGVYIGLQNKIIHHNLLIMCTFKREVIYFIQQKRNQDMYLMNPINT